MSHEPSSTASDVILEVGPLGFPWVTLDPFLFCVHHDDAYPRGNDALGPAASLAGRDLGQDFEKKDGFRMYHGDVVPGFPRHPHRGFETVTILRSGYVDHFDSLGATARFGPGDVQWLTAGRGIQHCEMFPLLQADAPNPLELFQIWLNLPARDKLVEPHFSMLWSDTIPRVTFEDEGKRAVVTLIAGRLGDQVAPAPPPHSWASRLEANVAIWTITLDPGASFLLPKVETDDDVGRVLYWYGRTGRDSSLSIGDRTLREPAAIAIRADRDVVLRAGGDVVEILMLQGRPIGEAVVQYGPFVMNTRAEIQQAIADYQRTSFGSWPFSSDAPVHPRDESRFAKHADGRVERASEAT